jgi:hypothetical protein
MTGWPTLDDYIVAAYRLTQGRQPNPAHTDFIGAFHGNSVMVAAAREEVARLAAEDRAGSTFSRDHQSKARHDTLAQMLARFDAQEPTP